MTINRAISLADELRPNLLDDGEKAELLIGMEKKLRRELGLEPGEIGYPADGDMELVAGEGYGDIYVKWLCGQIDLAHREYDNWNVAASVFNAQMEEFKKQYLRDNLPEKTAHKNVWRAEA